MPWRSYFLVLSCIMCFAVNSSFYWQWTIFTIVAGGSEFFSSFTVPFTAIEMVLMATESYGSSISRRVPRLTIRSLLIITVNSGKEPLKNKWIYSRVSVFEESWERFFSIERSESIPVSSVVSENCPMYWDIRGWLWFDINLYKNQWVVSGTDEI